MKSDNYNENNNNNDNNSNDNQATQTGSTLKFQLGPSLGWLKINKAVSPPLPPVGPGQSPGRDSGVNHPKEF